MAVNPIITETLPTLVGMGVVSRTAEVALTRRGRRAAVKRRKTSGKTSRRSTKTRKFGGKVYHLANTHGTKAVAERDAQYFRKAGHSARVVQVGGKWVVYVR